MLIDWFTVGAQALNFLILVWLMKRFLYKPILNAIDAREKGIALKLADAEAKEAEAKRERDNFQAKSKTFDEQCGARLAKATEEAKTERERLIEEARKESDSGRAAQTAALQNDLTRLGDRITRAAQDEVFAIARKTLADLADRSLEERMAAVFTRRLGEMDAKAKETLALALKSPSGTALVKSAFDLPDAQKAAIQNALNETFSADVRVRFETAPGVVCGIELTANGQKIGWSITDYLGSLDRQVRALLETRPAPVAPLAQTHPVERTDRDGAKPAPAGAAVKSTPAEIK